MRSTRAIARSMRSSGIDGEPTAPVAPAPTGPLTSTGDERAGAPASNAGVRETRAGADGSLRPRTSVRSAARSSSVVRPSSRAEACFDAAAPSAMRSRAEASISTRAWPRNTDALDATRHASATPGFPGLAAAERRGTGDRCFGRGIRARSVSAKRRRGGAADCSLFGGCTRSGCMSDSRKQGSCRARLQRNAFPRRPSIRTTVRRGAPWPCVRVDANAVSAHVISHRPATRASADPGLERQSDAIGSGAE